MGEITILLQAIEFAAEKHKTQRRKDVEASPYINHPIQVAGLIARIGEIEDIDVLVAEVTDDKSLPKIERKKNQVEHAAHISAGAKLIEIGDKTCNVTDLNISLPEGWDIERKRVYLEWSKQVVDRCRGTNETMELYYDEMLSKSNEALGAAD